MERLKGEVWWTVWGLGFLVVLPVKSKSLRPVSRTFRSLRFRSNPKPGEARTGTPKLTRCGQRSDTPEVFVPAGDFPSN
jgi:hypothetical protein